MYSEERMQEVSTPTPEGPKEFKALTSSPGRGVRGPCRCGRLVA